jgi:hypothetical protein
MIICELSIIIVFIFCHFSYFLFCSQSDAGIPLSQMNSIAYDIAKGVAHLHENVN